MNKVFLFELDKIQPSQLYLNEDKLRSSREKLKTNGISVFKPIPIKILKNKYVATDGHHRAFVLWQNGEKKVRVEWEDEELDWDLYAVCVKWCEDAGIFTIGDLKDKIISNEVYKELWINRCQKLHETLKRE